ncbi:MAG TPA: response regulator transcription factor [Salinibacter sp.]|nr:response regulator transcription factor [Salinibacter sp.]
MIEDTDDGHIHVYLVDDHPPIRDAIARVLEDTMDVELCGYAGEATQARSQIEAMTPNVAIIDISLEDQHGLSLVQGIRERHPQIELLVYSMYDENIYAERALRAGASGYLMKTESPSRLVEAIRRVERGEVYLSADVKTQVLGGIEASSVSEPHFAIDELTDREKQVFELLGQGHSVEEIGDKLDLTRKTIETYRRRAKEKLGLESVTALVQYAVQWNQVTAGDGSVDE